MDNKKSLSELKSQYFGSSNSSSSSGKMSLTDLKSKYFNSDPSVPDGLNVQSNEQIGKSFGDVTGLNAFKSAISRGFGQEAKDVTGMANAMSLGLARPAIKGLTGADIGEGSLLGRVVGSFTPSGIASRAVGGMTKFAPPMISGASKLIAEGATTALSTTPEASMEEFANTAKSKIMGGAGSNLALGATLGAIAKGYNSLPDSAKSASYRVINSLIKPSKVGFSYGKNPGRAIVEEGITANNFDELLSKTEDSMKKVWGKVSSKVKTSNTRVDLSGALSPLDDALLKAQKTPKVNSALISRIKDIKDDLSSFNLSSMTPDEVMDFKQTIGEITKFTGNQSDDKFVNASLKKIFGQTKDKLDSAVPGVSDLTERYADLISAKVAIKNREAVEQSRNLMQLLPKATYYGVSALGGAGVGGLAGALGAGVSAKFIDDALSSNRAKTEFAKFLSNYVSKMPRIKSTSNASKALLGAGFGASS